MRIVLAGGGTGGHIYPLITVANKIKENNPDTEIFYLGPFYEYEEDIFSKNQIKAYFTFGGKIRHYFSLLNFIDIFKIIGSFFQAIFWLWYIMPERIFSKGGYGSVPIVLVAWLYRIPIYLHDSDSIPGRANRFLSRFALLIFVSFESAKDFFKNKKVIVSGNPIRENLINGSAKNALLEFKLDPNRKKILVLGGSQGAKKINDLILNSLSLLVEKYEIIHQCGKKNIEEIALFLKAIRNHLYENYYHVFDYFDEVQLANLYAIADLIISRAGAGSIFEIAAVGKPSILIPLSSSANNHQNKNAYEYSKNGAALVLEENNLTPNLFVAQIEKILDTDLSKKMALNAKEFYKVDAAKIIADILSI